MRWSAAGRIAALSLVVFFGLGFQAAAQEFQFNSVTIEGNQRTEEGTVLSVAQLPVGRPLSADEVNASLQRVQGSGLFDSVEFIPNGNTLTIRVVELPTIGFVNIEGNRRLDDNELLPFVQSQPLRIYSPALAAEDAEAIATTYELRGRFSATVTPRIIERPGNTVDLVFEVTEGDINEIERISFIGNDAFSERRLRRVIATKQANIFRQFIQSDTFIADRLAFDAQVLADFYMSRGYVDFQVLDISTEISRDRSATFITFTVSEGQRFDFGDISVTSEVEGLNADDFLSELRTRRGSRYTPLAVDATVQRLENRAIELGRDFVRAEPVISRDLARGRLDVDFVLNTGPRVFIERIDIEGNQTTLDRVIRQQFEVAEGDPFNPREIQRSADRIRALGFFSQADVTSREGSTPEQIIVDVDVVEQPTGSFSFGGTFAVDDGLGLVVSFTEANFLGRGQTLSFDLSTTGQNDNLSLTFFEPAFLGRDLGFGLTTFFNEVDSFNSTFGTRAIGFSPSLEFPIGDRSRLQLSYSLSEDTVFDVSAESSPVLSAEQGSQITSAIGYSYSFDSRRNGVNQNRGVSFSFGQDIAGLGGDNQFLETNVGAIAQTTAFDEDLTLRLRVDGGAHISFNGDSRVSDRFFLSSRQLRGFQFRGVGPRDTTSPNLDPLGGNYFAVARFEADFPLGLPEELGITGGVFFDVGSVWGLDNTVGTAGTIDDGLNIRSTIGFSLFWSTPIGPLTFNFSQVLESEEFDREQSFDFTVTTRF